MMKTIRPLVLPAFAIWCVLVALPAAAEPAFQDELFAKYPKAATSLNGCIACHTNGNTSSMTPFGNDFAAAGMAFTPALEAKDSDGDGFTNLVELTASPATNPGDPASKPAGTVVANYQGLWWKSPAGSEAGWGINFAHQGDIIFATWFTYDATGKPWWLVAELRRSTDGAYRGTVYTVTGPSFAQEPWVGMVVETPVGSMAATFTGPNDGTLEWTVYETTRIKPITRQAFGPLPTCTWNPGYPLAQATNYQDLWWKAPAGSEAGWGVNLTHQGNTIFATWFTYDKAGKPWWLIALLEKSGTGVYSGPVSTVTGPSYAAEPWTGPVVESVVGSATLTVADGNHATFAYTVQGVTGTKAITRQVFVEPGTACR